MADPEQPGSHRRITDRPGDRIDLADWTIEVTGTDRNAVTEVRLRRRTPASDEPADEQ